MNEKNEQRIFNSKHKSVTIKGAKRTNVSESAGSGINNKTEMTKRKKKTLKRMMSLFYELNTPI